MTATAAEYKKVSFGSGDTHYLKPSQLTKGYEIVGTFTKTLTNEYGNTFILETAEGAVGLNSTKQLDRLMSVVSPGSNIKIIYQGKSQIKKGPQKGKFAHDFEVYVSTSGLTEAAAPAAQPAAPQPKKPNLSKVSG